MLLWLSQPDIWHFLILLNFQHQRFDLFSLDVFFFVALSPSKLMITEKSKFLFTGPEGHKKYWVNTLSL